MFKRKKTSRTLLEQIDRDNLPKHIGIIMDGNGRWAKKRGLPRTSGHAVGAENFRKIGICCRDLGIEYLTVYAFSTENWKRPPEESAAIMELFEKYLQEAIEKMVSENNRVRILGDVSALSPKLQMLISEVEKLSDTIDGVQANICINYGGRAEILRGVKSFAEDVKTGKILLEDIDEESFSDRMYTARMPEPELIIRPGGEQRLSNFLLWQCAYSEFYFTDVLWPDFDENELYQAIIEYQGRTRRFGAVK